MNIDVGLQRRLTSAEGILRKMFGEPVWIVRDPIDELVVTILSQNTNDRNRDAAFNRLKKRYSNWEQVAGSDREELEDIIKPAGLSRLKSQRIKDILLWIKASFSGWTLEALRSVGDDEAIAALKSQTGIGIKTAAVVMAFAFGRDLCPVDTHIHRIAGRLRWIENKTSAEKTFEILRPNMPPGLAASFHLNLLKFGRAICTARKPKCNECPFNKECSYSDIS
ncbi:MAG: endonuclease III [Calditrichaeota bacterium]|nr:endonuclease III [Calditrichota bacterium]